MTTGGEISLSIVFTVFILLDLVCNILVILTVHRSTSMQTPMNYLITNVAITDIVIAIFAFPRFAIDHTFTHPVGEAGKFLCKFITGGGFIWVSNATCGVLLMVIASERFLAVVFPLKKNLRQRITIRKIKYLVPLFWLYGLAVATPIFWVLDYHAEQDFCVENFPNSTSPTAYVGFTFTLNGAIPILVLSFLYTCIVTSLWRKGKIAVNASQAARYKARKKVTRMLLTITSLHITCWLPNYVTYLMVYVAPEETPAYRSVWHNITVLLIVFNSAANPFCYCLFMKNFRRGVLSIACWWRKQEEIDLSQRGATPHYSATNT